MRISSMLSTLSMGLILSSCGSSSSGGSGFGVVYCSLGCSGSGPGGEGQVTCGIQDVFVNGDLRVAFSQPVDPTSLSVFTVQMTDIITGKTPAADRLVDPNDARVIIYRPQLTFDSSGNPVFGLTSGASYSFKLPGEEEDPGLTYVRSVSGVANSHRLACTVEASLGVLDPVPGSPVAQVLVDVVSAYDPVSGEPSAFDLGVSADGASDVYRFSKITIEFDDLMNPATLVNPVSGESTTLSVRVDPDGVLSDASDQTELGGSYTISLDPETLTTTVVFETYLGLPSAGSDTLSPRKVIVETTASIADIGGNPLSDFGEVIFIPEVLIFGEVLLEENFLSDLNQDRSSTGAAWGDVPGMLTPGTGGGSGRLGALHLGPGEVLTLNTDFEDFSGINDPGIWDPADALETIFDGTSFTAPQVSGGLFEFSSMELETSSLLRLTGSNPARLFLRGEALVRGAIEVAGEPGSEHDTRSIFGQDSRTPGPSGKLGGVGGRLPSWEGFESLAGVVIPPDPKPPAPTLAELNGTSGEAAEDNLIAPTGAFGAGGGGTAWPQPTVAFPSFHMPADIYDILGQEWDLLFFCTTKMLAGVGGGAGFGLNGTPGSNKPLPGGFVPVTPPPPTYAGKANEFGLGIGSDPQLPQRTLSPEFGWLHGGAGGGGGGSHIANTATNGSILVDCTLTTLGAAGELIAYGQHSAPAGGAGGGALQLQAGWRANILGSLDASGGSGGSKLSTLGQGTGGGGGAGGALLVQSSDVILGSGPNRLDVHGGEGGKGAGGSRGGEGGAGLIRIETALPLLDADSIALKVGPDKNELAAMGATLEDIVSLGEFIPAVGGPNGFSGAQSCWMRPEGNFFLLTFQDDEIDPVTLDLTNPGWDMTVLPDPASLGSQPFRAPNTVFPMTLEQLLGNEIDASPVVVRFQGVRALTNIDNYCEVPLTGADSPVMPGSLTGWVDHPALLNDYFADTALRPNMVRFQIVFDTNQPTFIAIQAITGLYLRVLPD